MATTSIGTSELRIVRKYPGIALQRVWKNVNTTVLSDHIKSAWYTAVHEIIPTNERLTAIHLTTTTSCVRCGATDTLLHRLISCEEGSVIWTWTKTRIAAILRINPTHIPGEWTLRPTFHHRPPEKHAAIIWIVAHLVAYRLQTQRRLSLTDYMDFLQRTRWKEYHRTPKTLTVGRYLDVL